MSLFPTSILAPSGDKAAVVTLVNDGETPERFQVTVLDWSLDADGQDVTSPTKALLAAPSMVEIPPQSRRAVRLIRTQGVGTSAYFRVLLRQLPQPATPGRVQLLTGGQQATSLALEARTGGRWGVLSSTGQLNQAPAGFEMRRGMTAWQKDDLQRQLAWQAGDVYATSGIGPVALGGVRLAKDPAALDPLTPTWPVPTLGGIALDPGQVKVLSNQAEVTRQDVKAGPFTVEGRNVAFGASQTAVVVRDTFGRETAVSMQRLYVSPVLLRPGLSTWEIAAGQVREDENHYGKAGISGSWAKGVNERWTIRAGGQVDELGKGNLTVGSTWAPGTWGVWEWHVRTGRMPYFRKHGFLKGALLGSGLGLVTVIAAAFLGLKYAEHPVYGEVATMAFYGAWLYGAFLIGVLAVVLGWAKRAWDRTALPG